MNKTNLGSEESRQDSRQESRESRQPGAGRGRPVRPFDEKLSIDRMREISKNLGDQIESQIHERPFVVLGAVCGVGFVAGSLLGSRLGQIAIALAGGYLVRNIVNQASGPGGVQRIMKEGIDKFTQQERANG